MKGLVRVGIAAAIVVVLYGFGAVPAQATFPGGNGKIAAVPQFYTAFIYTINPDGSGLATLPLPAARVAWSPDGTKLALTTLPENAPRPWGESQLFIVNADGSDPLHLTRADSLTWSPDGSKLAFTDGTGIYVINSDGTELRPLASIPEADAVQWSPDGSQLAFSLDLDIWVINADGSGLKNLTNTSLDEPYGIEGGPSWSPDSSRIAFTALTRAPGAIAQTFVMDRDGTGRTRLATPIWSGQVVWSPDGSQIAFSHFCDSPAPCGIWAMNVDGSGLHPIADRLPVNGIDWQPIPFKNASKKCKALPGDYRNHGQCVKASP